MLFGADLNTAKVICERLKNAVSSANVQTDSDGIPVTVSIGVSQIKSEDANYTAALSLADEALFVAKRNDRNRVFTLEDMDFLSLWSVLNRCKLSIP